MSVYPTAYKSYTTKENGIDVVHADHINDLQTEQIAMQQIVGSNPHGTRESLAERLSFMIETNGALRQGSLFPTGAAVSGTGMLFWKSDENTLYAYSGTTWLSQGQSLSNVLFSFSGSSSPSSYYVGASLLGSGGQMAYWARNTTISSATYPIINTYIKKATGVNTITLYAKVWQNGGAIGDSGKPKVGINIGGLISTGLGDSLTNPHWLNFDLDVSSLDVGTFYETIIYLQNLANDQADAFTYANSIIGFAS